MCVFITCAIRMSFLAWTNGTAWHITFGRPLVSVLKSGWHVCRYTASQVLNHGETGATYIAARVLDVSRLAVQYLLHSPLRYVYVHGPSLGGYGFWGGLRESDICASLTTVPATFWDAHSDVCQHKIDAACTSVITLIVTCAYLKFVCQLCMVVYRVAEHRTVRWLYRGTSS